MLFNYWYRLNRKAPLKVPILPPLKISSKWPRPSCAREHYRHERVHHHHDARRSLRAIARSIGAGRDRGFARIAVCCPSGHVQVDSSSPFTGDLLLARTCNQGKIVDICRPSAGSGLPEGRRSPLLAASLPRAPRPSHPTRSRVCGKVHERVWNRTHAI